MSEKLFGTIPLKLQFASLWYRSHFSRAPWQINAISLIRPVSPSPTEALPPMVFISKSWAYHFSYKRPIHTQQCKHCEPASGLQFRYAVSDVFLCTSYLYSSTSCSTLWIKPAKTVKRSYLLSQGSATLSKTISWVVRWS